MATRIVLVSDVRLYLDGIVQLLSEEKAIDVVAVAATTPEALSVAARLSPDVVVVDLAMRDSLSVIERLVAEQALVKIVVLTASEDNREIIVCAEAGAAGYVTRDGSVKDLVRCLQAAKMGELHCSPKIAASLMRRVNVLANTASETPSQSHLTARERSILVMLHKPNKEIARELEIEVATVKNHVHHIFEKLGVHSRAEAVMYYSNFADAT